MTDTTSAAQAQASEKKRPGRPRKAAEPSPEKVEAPAASAISEADLRARIEAEMRAKIEAEVRAEMEANKPTEADPEPNASALSLKPDPVSPVGDPNGTTIHFLEDGLTLLSQTWMRGQELTLVPGTPQWEETIILGTPLVEMDEDEQILRWGKRFFRTGRWKGQNFDEIDLSDFTEAERRELLRAAQERKESLA